MKEYKHYMPLKENPCQTKCIATKHWVVFYEIVLYTSISEGLSVKIYVRMAEKQEAKYS